MRAPLDVVFLVCCIALTADVLVPEIFSVHGKTKDYPLWYWAGQQILHGKDIYAHAPGAHFDFIYPPLSAALLAIPAYFGKITLYIVFCLLNIAAWWTTAQLSNAMTGLPKAPPPWLGALPSVVMITFIFDMFDIGQPNLMLLALMLWGFWLLQRGGSWSAGAMFALATAIKAFPISVLPYLLWRRQWASAASMTIFLAIFLFVVPAPLRGFQNNVSDLKTWYQGMVGSSSAEGFGQRADQNWSLINQSLIAMTHRLTRHINYNEDDPAKPPAYMNIVNLDFKTANWVMLGVSVAIGLGFVVVMPSSSRRTPRSDAEELGILFCLMTIASPLARQYYFLWLFFPVTVLMNRAVYDPRPAVRKGTWIVLAIALVLASLSLRIFPAYFQAYGNNFIMTVLIAGALGWYLLNPPEDIKDIEHIEAAPASAPVALSASAGTAKT